MSLNSFLGEPAPIRKFRTFEAITAPEQNSPIENLKLSMSMERFFKYVNTYPLDSDLRKSAAFSLLNPIKRPLYAKHTRPYIYPERLMVVKDKVILRDSDYNSYSLENFVDENKFDRVSDFVKNILAVTYGKEPKYTIIRTAEEAEQALKSFLALGRPISMDIETSGLDPYTSRICGVGLSSSASGGVYIPLVHIKTKELLSNDPEDNNYTMPDSGKMTKLIREYMPKIPFIGHNMKFEYGMFKINYNIEIDIAHCTMLGEYAIDERLKRRYSLGASVGERFREVMKWKESKDFIKNIINLPPSRVGRYCVRDVCFTYLLYMAQLAYIHKYVKRVYYEIDLPYTYCASEAELHGFELDKEYVLTLADKLNADRDEQAEKIYEIVGHECDIASNQKLQQVLYDEMKFPVIKTTKTGKSTDKATLGKLLYMTKNPIFQHILDWRTYAKLASTYTTAYFDHINPITNRIHPSYMLTTTVTGRISCTNPNLQNIPKNASSLIRRMFLAPKGYILIFADYSGQEIRVLTALSRDENLLKAHNPCRNCNKAGSKSCPKVTKMDEWPKECHPVDVHSLVATKLFKKELAGIPVWEIKGSKDKKVKRCRSLAKSIDFALVYGGGPDGIAEKSGITVEEARALVEEYFKQFPGVRRVIDELHETALSTGQVQDLAGRYRHFIYAAMEPDKDDPASPFWQEPEKTASGFIRGIKKGWYGKVTSELRQAQNFPMQGTAASMTKEASVCMRNRFRQLPHRPSLIGFIHDETVSCCIDDPKIVKETVEAIKLAMTKDICLSKNYGFPEELPIELSVDLGYAWGESMTLEEYMTMKSSR